MGIAPQQELTIKTKKSSTDDQHWRSYRLIGKVTEAKHLQYTKQDVPVEFYTSGRLDNRPAKQFVSKSILSAGSPFWAEDFEFETKDGFKDIKFVIWSQFKRDGIIHEFAVGKVVIPRISLKSTDEQWYMLMDASNETKSVFCLILVTGSIQLHIKYITAKVPRKTQGFSITVVKAKDLTKERNSEAFPNAFVVLHMLPDREAITTQHTNMYPKNNSPPIYETFFFTGGPSAHLRELHCAVWSQESNESLPLFLGHCTIPMAPVITRKMTNRWYCLSSLSNDADLTIKRGSRKITEDEKKNRPREFVKSLHDNYEDTMISSRAHQWIDKTFALTPCSHCASMMVGAQSCCSLCSLGAHNKCQTLIPEICGGLGQIRLKLEVEKITILPLDFYQDLMTLLYEEDFLILNMLGRVSHFREEAAKCMVQILSHRYGSFVQSCIKQEILLSQDSKTLFRANSMASKSLDVYMRHIGSEYLKSTLEDVLKLILLSKKPFEMDPTRLEATKKKEENENNSLNMRELNMIITDCIFTSVSKMPSALKDVFELIQTTVHYRFPGNENVKYTSVTGFIFLRFFTPAILNPSLFGLNVGTQDSVATRKLLLISKTIQNLSNLVEFGQKEPFMEPMNTFITSRIPEVKKFIDSIAGERNDIKTPSFGKLRLPVEDVADEVIARNCADLVPMFLSSMDKLTSSVPSSPLVAKLSQVLHSITSKTREVDEYDRDFSTDFLNDTGVNADLDSLLNLEEERKLLRMFMRCPSSDKLDSPMSPSTMGTYRSSTDLRGEMVKGQVEAQIDFPIVTLTSPQENLNFTFDQADPDPTMPLKAEKSKNSPAYRLSLNGAFRRAATVKKEKSVSKESLEREDYESYSPENPRLSSISMSSLNSTDGTAPTIKQRGHSKATYSNEMSDSAPALYAKPSSRTKSSIQNKTKSSPLSQAQITNGCCRCSKQIGLEACFVVDNKKYHTSCLTCKVCDVSLKGFAFLFEDALVCKEDYFKLSGFTCQICDTPIMQDYIKINGKMIHAGCKQCSVCQGSLSGKEFTTIGNAVFCSDHHDSIPCFGCQKAIVGQVVQANDKFYHPDHFRCYTCQKDLNGCVNYDSKEHAYCQWCYMSLEIASTASADLLSASPKEIPKDTPVVAIPAESATPILLRSQLDSVMREDRPERQSRGSSRVGDRKAIRIKDDAVELKRYSLAENAKARDSTGESSTARDSTRSKSSMAREGSLSSLN